MDYYRRVHQRLRCSRKLNTGNIPLNKIAYMTTHKISDYSFVRLRGHFFVRSPEDLWRYFQTKLLSQGLPTFVLNCIFFSPLQYWNTAVLYHFLRIDLKSSMPKNIFSNTFLNVTQELLNIFTCLKVGGPPKIWIMSLSHLQTSYLRIITFSKLFKV